MLKRNKRWQDYSFLIWANGELAAAVLLVVEAVLAEQLVAAFLQAALAPVAGPEADLER